MTESDTLMVVMETSFTVDHYRERGAVRECCCCEVKGGGMAGEEGAQQIDSRGECDLFAQDRGSEEQDRGRLLSDSDRQQTLP